MIMGKTLNEASGVFYIGKNLHNTEDLLLENQIDKFKKEKDEKIAAELLVKAMKAKQEEIDKKVDSIELIPMGNKVLFLPYVENPYKKNITSTGIIMPEVKTFKSPDSGEIEVMKDGIKCAKVIEVGPDCTRVKVGDDFYYHENTAVSIPFYSQGYKVLAEPQVYIIINEGLKERFNMK